MRSLARIVLALSFQAVLPMLALNVAGPETWAATTGTWSATGSMSTTRDGHTITTLSSGLVLVTGGTGSGGWLASAEVYDPASGLWSPVSSMSTSRRDHTATLLPNGKVLVAGGYSYYSTPPLKSAEIFDPSTGLWSPAGNMATGRKNHTATLLANGKVLIAGGWTSFATGGVLMSSEIYDPSTNSWTPAGDMTTPRYYHAATRLTDGRVLVTGGTDVAGSELYDPGTNSWSVAADMGISRTLHTATLLADGRVLVAGGNGPSGALAEAELYDPGANAWSVTGSMNDPRAAHTAVRLGDGRVIVAGGSNDCFYSASSELYDPVSSTWSWSGSLTVDRTAPMATALVNGKVLLAGGFGVSSGGMTDAVDLYDVTVVPPLPPTAVVAAAGDETAAVSWTQPPTDADPVLEYVVTECPDGYIFHVSAGESGAILDGLYNDETVTATVVTRKAYGASPPSLPSNAVTPTAGSPPPEAASGTVPAAGGAVTTDTSGTGPTSTDTIETTVTVPPTASGATVTIAETAQSGPAPAGYQFLGQQVVITSDAPTTALNPLVIRFVLDESIVSGQAPASIQIFRTEAGGPTVLVPNCTGAGGIASPDPCVSDRTYVQVTDIQITVLASTASLWNMALASGGCQAPCDDGNPCTQDSCDPQTSLCRFDPLPGLSCDDGNACTAVDLCVAVEGGATCQGSLVDCNDGITCTIDSCDPTVGCQHAPDRPGEVGVIQFTDQTTIAWSPTADATHWNAYRGTIPTGMLGSRLPGNVYDTACFEGGGVGSTDAFDSAAPELGTAFYYLVTAENACGESTLGHASSQDEIPNTSPCPTPP